VEAYSKRVRNGSIALAGILKELFHGKEDVVSVVLPDILDDTFVNQLLLGTDSAHEKTKSTIIKSYYQRHPQLMENMPARHQGDTNIYVFGATKYVTNLKNMLKMTFKKRVRKYLNEYVEVNKDQNITNEHIVLMLFKIMGWPLSKQLKLLPALPASLQNEVAEQRRILGNIPATGIGKGWFLRNGNLINVLRYFVYLNRFKEQHGLPTFNIVPICRPKAHFITMDTLCFFGLMKDLKLVADNHEAFLDDDVGMKQWESQFGFRQLVGKMNSKSFTRTIDTDGVSIGFHFQRLLKPGEVKKGYVPEKPTNMDDYRVIGIDPGRTLIIYAIEKLKDDEYRSWVLSRKQYYAESGIFAANKKVALWTVPIQAKLNILSATSSKGMDLAEHERFMAAYIDTRDALWDEYLKPRWAESRLRVYGGKKRTFANFYNSIINADKSKPVLVAYGSAKFAPTGKGEIAVPVSRAYKECASRMKTIPTDEFRSTAVHHKDDSVLQYVKRADTDKKVRGLLWCCSTSRDGEGKFVNRDRNAAINILRCLVLPQRPASLTRTADTVKLVRVVKKTIPK